jgi:hypothetical protein
MQSNNPVPAKIRAMRRTVTCALAALAISVTSLPAISAEPGIHIELNKIENIDDACHGLFVFQNTLGQSLETLSMELVVFNQDGGIDQSLLVGIAPLTADKTTVARFALSKNNCESIGRVLINQFPTCKGLTEEPVNCLSGLSVSSRSTIEFFK